MCGLKIHAMHGTGRLGMAAVTAELNDKLYYPHPLASEWKTNIFIPSILELLYHQPT